MEKFNNIKLLPVIMLMAIGLLLIVWPLTPTAQATSSTQTPTLTVTIAATITLTLPVTSVAFPTITPGTPVATSSTSTITTNNATGFNFGLTKEDNVSTLSYNTDPTIHIPDKTEWQPAAATSTPGNAAAIVTPESVLAFRVPIHGTQTCAQAATWWGVDASPLWAGIPTTTSPNSKIANCSDYRSASSDVPIWYRLDVSTTQKSGDYKGNLYYTATTNP